MVDNDEARNVLFYEAPLPVGRREYDTEALRPLLRSRNAGTTPVEDRTAYT